MEEAHRRKTGLRFSSVPGTSDLLLLAGPQLVTQALGLPPVIFPVQINMMVYSSV